MNTTKPIQIGDITLLHVKDVIPVSFWENTPHSHDHCEIFIHEEGNMNVFVENTTYSHTGKEVRIYAPNELHFGCADTEQQMEWYQISVKRSLFENCKALGDIFFNRERGKHNVFVSQKHAEMVALAVEIFEKFDQESPLAESYFIGNITRILCFLNEKSYNCDVGIKENKRLQEIIHLIDEHYMYIYSAKDLYKYTNLSTSYIHRLFKSHLHTTPHQFILMKKLNKARELLAAGKNVTAACYDSGFNNYTNFITLFKQRYGITPKKYSKGLPINSEP